MLSAGPAYHLGRDELEFKFGVGHAFVFPQERPAEFQRFRHNLAQGPHLDPDDVDVPADGMRPDHTGDGLTQREFVHTAMVPHSVPNGDCRPWLSGLA